MVTWFTSDCVARFSVKSNTSSNFVPLAPKSATATGLSVQRCWEESLSRKISLKDLALKKIFQIEIDIHKILCWKTFLKLKK